MNYLTIFNFIVNIIIMGYLVYKVFPFHISVNKTFWCKRVTALTIMMYTKRSEYGSSSKGLFTIPIRNYKKAEEWDGRMYKSGEYKKYR